MKKVTKKELKLLSQNAVDALKKLEEAVYSARHYQKDKCWHEYNVQLMHIRSSLVSTNWCNTINTTER